MVVYKNKQIIQVLNVSLIIISDLIFSFTAVLSFMQKKKNK